MRKYLLLLLLSVGLFAQTGSPKVETLIPVNEGLSQGMVFSILQTSDDFLWVATKDGLNRYDGYRFEVFLPDPFNPYSIAAGETRKLFEDKEGNLWVAYLGGIDVYIPKKGRFLHLNWANMQGFDGETVNFTQTPDGSIWVADKLFLWKLLQPQAVIQKAIAHNQNQVAIEANYTKFSAIPSPKQNIEFNGILFSKALGLVTTTDEGLFRVDEGSLQMTPIHDALVQTTCTLIGEDKNGALWVQQQSPTSDTRAVNTTKPWYKEIEKACNVYIFTHDKNSAQWETMPCATYSQFDPEGKLWQYSPNGVRMWQPEHFLQGNLPELTLQNEEALTNAGSYYHTDLCIDRSGVVWLGTSGYGLLKGNSVKPKFNQLPTYASMRKMYEDPSGNVFFSVATNSAYKGWHHLEPTTNSWFINYNKPDIFFLAAAFDKSGNLWLNEFNNPISNFGNNNNKLLRIDGQTRQITPYNWVGADLVCLPNGNLLSVTQEGLHTINPTTGQKTFYPFDTPQKFTRFNDAAANNLFIGKNNEIWITDIEGFIDAAPTEQGFTFTHYQTNPQNRQSLSNNVVMCILEDPLEPQRFLWIGTKGGGLNRMDRQTGAFKHYKREQGLPDNVIYGILPDEQGHIWLSTNNGLCRFHVRTETVQNFTITDGLPCKEFNKASYLKTQSGHLLFGGVNGVAYFHPDSLQFNRRPPVVHITRLYVNNQLAQIQLPKQLTTGNNPSQTVLLPADIAYTQNITLQHDQNLLTIEFAALDFTNPNQNQYRYQLVGLNPNWVELNNKNTIQFANLKPGNYTFNVLGSNNDGTWAEQPATLHIRILPPWWLTNWAYLFYLLFTTLAIYTGYRYQLRRQWERQENHRLKELDDFKNRFFTNITHEFRTPLTVILGAGEELAVDLNKTMQPPTVTSKLNLIQRSGENLLRLINQLLDLSKLESGNLQLQWVQGNIVPYLRYIVESLQSLANTQQISLQTQIIDAEIVMDYDPERILQIVYNLLSNAIKFTPAGGQVVLSIDNIQDSSGKPQLRLRVTDTGVGISPTDLPFIFDRFYQANNLIKAKTGGTGIGLALTQELVKAMGGSITVTSQPNIATTFTVLLPITHLAPLTANEALNNLTELPLASNDNQLNEETVTANEIKPTLLLIEDNPDVADFLHTLLQHYYHLSHAYNGQQGIDLALQLIPDLIISDVMMPHKDGFEVCQFLKSHEHTSHIPIVLLTAKAEVQHRIAGLKKGADAYLAKPFNKEELLTTLSNLLELRRKMQIRFAASLIQATQITDLPLPETNTTTEPNSPNLDIDFEHAFLKKLTNILDQHLDNTEFDIPEFCRLSGISQAQLYRKIKALTNLSIAGFIRRYRLEKGKILLETSQLSISEIAYLVGFASLGYFSKSFLEEFGIRPQSLRK
ncbi:MAG TPA: ATP-binding protein [Chitinophagales bacterium]|nr:ATP-binding protein [Chitinophagales bacterium]